MSKLFCNTAADRNDDLLNIRMQPCTRSHCTKQLLSLCCCREVQILQLNINPNSNYLTELDFILSSSLFIIIHNKHNEKVVGLRKQKKQIYTALSNFKREL